MAADCATAVILVPASESAPSPFTYGTAAEIAAFGARTFTVFADDASLAAFGPNPLDPRCRIPSALAGREQVAGWRPPSRSFWRDDDLRAEVAKPVQGLRRQLAADLNDFGRAVEFQTAASGSGGYLD